MSYLKDLYEQKYLEAKFTPFLPNPDAVTTSRLDDVFRLLRGNTGCLLEIGSGSGAFCMAIAEQFDQVVGIELAEVRVALAREALQAHYPQMVDKVAFVAGNADEPLPFADKSFDSVVACAVLEHVVDIYKFMDEAARVCKPGGTLIMTVPNVAYIKSCHRSTFWKTAAYGISGMSRSM
jgi:ubiquinone/menaquinone biosynthesis C-methylase UbiE